MKGTQIIVTSKPRGVFEEVIVTFSSGTVKPGVCMELVPSVEPIAGIYRYAVYGTQAGATEQYVSADGDKKVIAILLEKRYENGIYSDAYTTLDRGLIYFPVAGEKFNMQFEDVSGTGDDLIIGEECMLDDGTGKLLTADNNAEQHPFTCLETVTNPTADHWQLCRFNGHGGM